MSSAADPRSPSGPVPSPLGPPSRLGLLFVAVVIVAIVAFGLGYRLGPGPSPQGTSGPTPGPASPSPSPVDFRPGVIGERLERAYKSAGGGWQLCALDDAPACRPQNEQLSGRLADPALLAPSIPRFDWEALGPRVALGRRLVLVADLRAEAAVAFLAGPLSDSAPVPRKTQVTTIPWGGVFYIDLGSLEPGRYSVIVGGLAAVAVPTSAPGAIRSPEAAAWWTYEAAFEVR